MNPTVKHFYDRTLAQMQEHDEIGGPEGQDYVELMSELIRECQTRRETAQYGLNCQAVVDLLTDNGGAMLYWQIPESLQSTAERMIDSGDLWLDHETDCYAMNGAVKDADGSFSLPHQFER